MKKIVFLFSIIITTFFSCEDNRLEGMYDDSVLFVNSGKIPVSGFLSDDFIEIDVPIYRSGISQESGNVSVEVDPSLLDEIKTVEGEDFLMLPNENYVLASKDFVFKDNKRSATLKISIDIKKLYTIQNILDEKFAIPLVLKSDGINIAQDKRSMVVVPILTGGIRPGSAQTLWSKTFTELGIDPTNHFTASLAVTSQYLFVNTRNEDLKYYDRFTGEYKGSIVLPFKGSLTNFTVTNDDHNNLLITNLRNEVQGTPGQQTVYIIENGGAPREFIKVTHNYLTGRKMSVLGDLTGDAIITSAGQSSSNVLIWRVENGQLQSQSPEILIFDNSSISWNSFADAIPLSLDLNDGLFVVGFGDRSNFGYFGRNGVLHGAFALNQFGIPAGNTIGAQSLAMVKFNGARYLALAIQAGASAMYSYLVDVTKTERIGVWPTTSLLTYASSPISTTNNANLTADIQVRLSEDKKSFIMYSLGTNGSITATKFTD